MEIQERLLTTFESQFGEEPAVTVRGPGRVNLIGEHTDYNDGFVLPMAINRAVWIALRPRPDTLVQLTALDMGQTATFPLTNLERNQATWLEYVKGMAWALQQQGYQLTGWEGIMAGDLPIGAGLSSSAAVEMAAGRAFLALSGDEWRPTEIARLGQRVENEWLGIGSGIMDQLISASGQANHALLIDCRTLETTPLPLPPQTTVLILDSGTRRGLVDSAYNERRQQCDQAAAYFQVAALRDVSLTHFLTHAHGLDELSRRRAHHVISENERVLATKAALLAGDPGRAGQLINQSHASLNDDFEVSTAALNTIVRIAQQQPGCYGARLTGAGFGGCAVALVQEEKVTAFMEQVAAGYQQATGLSPNIYSCQATAGAELFRRKQ